MIDTKVSLRYACSIFQLAVEENKLTAIAADIDLINGAIKSHKELRSVIISPIFRPEVKLAVLDKIFSSKISIETQNFIKLVVGKSREALLESICDKFVVLKNEHLGIANAEIKSAYSLSDVQLNEIKEKLSAILNKKINVSVKIDKEVIGGFIARVDDTIYDASVKHQLDVLRKQFYKGNSALN
ncbi:MAG: ATP synthase F1 subunit delta [Bacteroidota bacterium]|nr:ATP synthase F1 subunit delta [Bacteroidota bacterium]